MKIGIVLGLHNGPEWVGEQLSSIVDQTHSDWVLYIRDDGGPSQGREIAKRFAATYKNIHYAQKASSGLVDNFLSGLSEISDTVDAVAFSDQDDIWLPNKLERAAAHLKSVKQTPGLYCSDSYLLTQNGKTITKKTTQKQPSFANALIENIAQGSTLVLNQSAYALVKSVAAAGKNAFMHDWWMYQLIAGAGGDILYDTERTLLYRQHAGNQLGDGRRVGSWISNKKRVVQGAYKSRLDSQCHALGGARSMLTPENQDLLQRFSDARNLSSPWQRMKALRALPVYRQSRLSQFSFLTAAAAGYV